MSDAIKSESLAKALALKSRQDVSQKAAQDAEFQKLTLRQVDKAETSKSSNSAQAVHSSSVAHPQQRAVDAEKQIFSLQTLSAMSGVLTSVTNTVPTSSQQSVVSTDDKSALSEHERRKPPGSYLDFKV